MSALDPWSVEAPTMDDSYHRTGAWRIQELSLMTQSNAPSWVHVISLLSGALEVGVVYVEMQCSS